MGLFTTIFTGGRYGNPEAFNATTGGASGGADADQCGTCTERRRHWSHGDDPEAHTFQRADVAVAFTPWPGDDRWRS